MDVPEAFALISRAIDAGRAAHGYLICGDLRGQADRLTDLVLAKLFPDAPRQAAAHTHPDIAWLEPEGRSRTIKAEAMGARLIAPMSATAFAGGWKVGVIVGADRLQQVAANAFLKTLEEPTPKTLFLLLTEAPDTILPTILSRTQRINLPLSAGLLEGDAYAAVAEVFTAAIPEGVCEKAAAGRRLAAILGALKDEAADADVVLVRRAFYRTLLSFARAWLVEGRLPRYRAFRNIEAIEVACRQSDRSLPDEAVLCALTDRLSFPS